MNQILLLLMSENLNSLFTKETVINFNGELGIIYLNNFSTSPQSTFHGDKKLWEYLSLFLFVLLFFFQVLSTDVELDLKMV